MGNTEILSVNFSVNIRTLAVLNNNSRQVSVWLTENFSVIVYCKAFQCGFSVVGHFRCDFQCHIPIVACQMLCEEKIECYLLVSSISHIWFSARTQTRARSQTINLYCECTKICGCFLHENIGDFANLTQPALSYLIWSIMHRI